MDIRTPHIRTPYIGTPSIKAQSVGASLVTGATKDVIATPVIALTGNSVTITCATTGATIYYTLDGSTPTSSSTQYGAAFTLDSSCTIKAIAIKGGKSSAVAEESYVKPVTYLTQWKIVGNSEVHGQEIWSCGEYSAVDNKYHIVVLPFGKSPVDIVLSEPLRKTDNTADTLEYPTETSGKALLTIRVEESGGELSPLDTPTTELVDAPQIEEADSYSCVISPDGKAVSWSEFLYTLNYLLTDSENNLLVDSENYQLTVQS